MVPTSWRVREGGGALVLVPRCYTRKKGLVRLVGRLPVGWSAWASWATLQRSMTAEGPSSSVLAALVTRVDSAYHLACARGRWCNGADATVLRVRKGTGTASGPFAG